MMLQSLSTLEPDLFFEQFALPGRIVNLHIPKTAGTSLRREMSRYKAIIPIEISYDGTVEDTIDHYGKYRRILRRKKLEVMASRNCFITGHYRFRDLMAEYGDIATSLAPITFLREPARRFASDYFYSISPRHPGREGFLETYPTLDAYIDDPSQHNKMSFYLRMAEGENIDAMVERVVVGSFGFVGCVERYDLCARVLFHLIGRPFAPSAHENTSPNADELEAALAEKADAIRDVNRDDIALYAAVRAIWDAKAESVAEWLDAQAEPQAARAGAGR